MRKYDPNDDQELDDLLRQVDDLLARDDDRDEQDDLDVDQYAPPEARDQAPMFYQNYSNDYGRQVRNYQNGYGGQAVPEEPGPAVPQSPIYNADFRTPRREKKPRPEPEYRDYGVSEPAPQKPKKKRGCGCLPMLVTAVLVIVLGVFWLFDRPEAADSIGSRKPDTATILLCGTDIGGNRTDTMMLLYLSGSEKRVGLLSLPRDSYTITSTGDAAKLNSAYVRNGKGEEGMEGLMDYVQEIIGYRPDGYILVDMDLVEDVADAMGGIEMEVPQAMEVDGISLDAGMQQLNGEQILTMLRYRAGYWNADLGRVEMQRQVLSECIKQWLNPSKLLSGMGAMGTAMDDSITSLTARNMLWVVKTVALGMGGLYTETLPGYPEYVDGVSYYLLSRGDIAALVNESFNPYQVEISPDDLKIAE